jgi:hypothetical protein
MSVVAISRDIEVWLERLLQKKSRYALRDLFYSIYNPQTHPIKTFLSINPLSMFILGEKARKIKGIRSYTPPYSSERLTLYRFQPQNLAKFL